MHFLFYWTNFWPHLHNILAIRLGLTTICRNFRLKSKILGTWIVDKKVPYRQLMQSRWNLPLYSNNVIGRCIFKSTLFSSDHCLSDPDPSTWRITLTWVLKFLHPLYTSLMLKVWLLVLFSLSLTVLQKLSLLSCPRCLFITGYQGDGRSCTYVGACSSDNGGCHSQAQCLEDGSEWERERVREVACLFGWFLNVLVNY